MKAGGLTDGSCRHHVAASFLGMDTIRLLSRIMDNREGHGQEDGK